MEPQSQRIPLMVGTNLWRFPLLVLGVSFALRPVLTGLVLVECAVLAMLPLIWQVASQRIARTSLTSACRFGCLGTLFAIGELFVLGRWLISRR